VDDWIKALFVIVVAVGGEGDLPTIRASVEDRPAEQSISWLEQEIGVHVPAFATNISTNVDKLKLRRQTTRDIMVVTLAKRPYFVTGIDDSTISLQGPSRQTELRFSVFEATWDGRALIISDSPIIDDSDLGHISARRLTLNLTLATASLGLMYLIYYCLRKHKK
jgi:hypothetical protein